jgi:hypothetical protein
MGIVLCCRHDNFVRGLALSPARLPTTGQPVKTAPFSFRVTEAIRRDSAMPVSKDEFKPGDKVEASGIYRVTHDLNHTAEHEVTVVFGKRFPPCNQCGHYVRFILVKRARHIEQHDDFK